MNLTPPDHFNQTSPITLEPPAPINAVSYDEADNMVKLDTSKIPELDAKVSAFIQNVLANPIHSNEFNETVNAIHQLGNAEIRACAQISNRMLDRPAKNMDNALFDNSPIAKSLIELRGIIEDLNPNKHGVLSDRRKFFGIIPSIIPIGNKIQDYFRKYESSQIHINKIIESLYQGKDELLKDNASIEQEKVTMWTMMQSLRQYIYVGKKIDEQLEHKIYALEVQDPQKARIVKEEMLFYVRQKNMDFLTQLAVNIQGYLALDMIRKNNLELIKGVDRATTTTVSALRTAVMVAQAMNNQKLVLSQINALNIATASLIEATSTMLKRQTGQLHEQASNSGIQLEILQKSFNNIYETMDSIDQFKHKALDNMQKTVKGLRDEINKAQHYLDRSKQQIKINTQLKIDDKKLDKVNI
ncbi:toxic anion resistance family protein [Moraxella macacae 0408225]|uniref:Toxic anion resistance family protein n=1 Tax=Moraxella macacae 0408225 TaxID=1230338 RepID=L2F9Q9_9GAMM|nr:toxic anion resistance protein [Moraxella macacae]ELA09620.1 toxic anion resistance family protein [Moraxella macacae 0408225]